MNIKFNYLYRDAGNFKTYGCVIFTAPNPIDLERLDQRIRDSLIDQEYFFAAKVSVPDLHATTWDYDLDHSWHEYEGLELTGELSNDQDKRDIDTFVSTFNF
jgi:hypothetical protein